MAFTDLELNDFGAVERGFVAQSKIPNGSDFIESTATPNDVRRISIRHSNAGPSAVKGAKPLRRHLVSFIHEKFNSTTNKTEKATFNVTITVDPQASSITTANQKDLMAFAESFLSETNLAKLLRDET